MRYINQGLFDEFAKSLITPAALEQNFADAITLPDKTRRKS
jgi:hypothetical protein